MIGGNKELALEVLTASEKDENGIVKDVWQQAKELMGYLDLMTGTANHTVYNAKVEESTHIFISDYEELPGITAENSRAVIDGNIYEITYIDNVMELNEHYEIYLKKANV